MLPLLERAESLRLRGEAWLSRGSLDVALDLLDAACALAQAADGDSVLAAARASSARAHHLAHRLPEAERLYALAIEAYERRRDGAAVARVRASAGFAAYDRGALRRAEALLRRAHAEAEGASSEAAAAIATGFAANVARARGQYARALRGYRRAIDRLERAEDLPYVTVFRMDAAIAMALMGDARGARGVLAKLEASSSQVAALVAHYRFMLARLEGDVAARPEPAWPLPFLARVRDVAGEAARAATGDRVAELRAACPPFEHARLGVLLLDRLVARERRAGQLLVASDGSWVALGDGPTVELRARGAPARILAALASARGPVAAEELVAAAWPGERILPRAASNRLHVAISTLRSLGLREVLRLTRGGYHLDARVTIAP